MSVRPSVTYQLCLLRMSHMPVDSERTGRAPIPVTMADRPHSNTPPSHPTSPRPTLPPNQEAVKHPISTVLQALSIC